MQIPLNQFEQYIDETILKRGLAYFKKGYVNEPEEITPDVFEAIVVGTEDYTVQLKIINGTITEHVCSCPYDLGPVCKHVVAVLFYLQQDALDIKAKVVPLHPKQKSTIKKAKKKTISEQLNEVLEKISTEELKQFIREISEQTPSFRNIFLSAFAHKNTNESKELYTKQVKSILRTALGRAGFIYWNKAGSVGKQVSELLTTAQKQLKSKNYKSAVFICTAVMEEMTAALQFADDSNGDIGGCIDYAYELLNNIVKENIPEEIRTHIFNYCLSSFEKRVYSGWDWHLGILQIASEICNNDEESQLVMSCLDKAQYSQYEEEEAQHIKLNIIRKIKGEAEAEKFIEQNLSNPKLRREAITNALKYKDYEKAIRISKEGIKHDKKDKPGLAQEWNDWLLKTAQEQKDIDKILEYARALFIDNFRNEQNYYQLMKSNVPSEKWELFIEEIINDISKKKRWLDIDLIAGIYIKEERWERLMNLVSQNSSLQKIEFYEKYLSKNYPDELAKLYEQNIIEYLKKSIGRSHYQTACKYLRRMLKLGARDRVNAIIENLRKQYPQRKALLEELNRV